MESITIGLDRFFHLTEKGTTIGTEVRAGSAAFFTLSYLLLVNPQMMAQAGVPYQDAVFATALSAAVSCFVVGLLGNQPFGMAPGLGLTAYLSYSLVPQCGSLKDALSACFCSGILVLLVTVTGLSSILMKIPQAIKTAIVVGMGLLIAMIGMVSVGLITADPDTLVTLGSSEGTIVGVFLGIILVGSLLYHDIKGGILIGIAILTIIDWTFSNSWPSSIIELPSVHRNDYIDLGVLFDSEKASILLPAVGCFLLICLFDISGVMYGLATLGGLLDETGNIPNAQWAFIASAVGTCVAASLGSTPIIVCVECAAGIKEGGKTGLTAVVIGLLFTASLFLAPLFSSVPTIATSPILVIVGVMMMSESGKISWNEMNHALPAFLTLILMPLTYSITNGMLFGLAASASFYITTGQCFGDIKSVFLSKGWCNRAEENIDSAQLINSTANDANKYGAV